MTQDSSTIRDPEPNSIRPYALVMLLAGALRIAWALAVPVATVSDCAVYDGAARRLAQGLPYTIDAQTTTPSAYWPVGTSFAYSLVYRVFGPEPADHAPVIAFNFVISLAVVALSMGAARKWFGRHAAIGTGILMALWPMHIEFTTIVASEPIFTACILAGMILWPDCPGRDTSGASCSGAYRARNIPRLFIAGLFFAAATYIRPTALLFPGIMAGIDFLRTRRIVLPAIRAAIAGIAMLLAILPWSLRNYHAFHQVVLVSCNGGSNLWMGNNPDTTGYYMPPPSMPDLDEAHWDKELGNRAKEYIQKDPIAFVKRTAIKALKLHDRETIGVAWNKDGLQKVSPSLMDPKTGMGTKALKALSSGYWYLMLAGGGIGFIVLARRDGPWKAITHPTVVIFAYFTAVHAVMVIQDRYHYPVTPMVAALASLTLGRLLCRRERTDIQASPA